MFKQKIYDQPVAKRTRPAEYQAEFEAVHGLNSSKHTNMLLEYDSESAAHNAHAVIKRHIKQARMPLEVKIRNKVFVVVERRKTYGNDAGGNEPGVSAVGTPEEAD